MTLIILLIAWYFKKMKKKTKKKKQQKKKQKKTTAYCNCLVDPCTSLIKFLYHVTRNVIVISSRD